MDVALVAVQVEGPDEEPMSAEVISEPSFLACAGIQQDAYRFRVPSRLGCRHFEDVLLTLQEIRHERLEQHAYLLLFRDQLRLSNQQRRAQAERTAGNVELAIQHMCCILDNADIGKAIVKRPKQEGWTIKSQSGSHLKLEKETRVKLI